MNLANIIPSVHEASQWSFQAWFAFMMVVFLTMMYVVGKLGWMLYTKRGTTIDILIKQHLETQQAYIDDLKQMRADNIAVLKANLAIFEKVNNTLSENTKAFDRLGGIIHETEHYRGMGPHS